MPECLEAEAARLVIAAHAVGRVVKKVEAPDDWFLKRGLTPTMARAALKGETLTDARRIGKQLLVDTNQHVLGLHLGMSGRVIVDDVAAGDPLLYATNRNAPEWYRFGVRFTDGGSLWLRDPRRLGGVELDPDESRWGPDVFTVSRVDLDVALGRSIAPLKAILMDQARIAGLGNLLTDEALWRAGLDPARAAGGLSAEERVKLHKAVRATIRVCSQRGGSHTGDLQASRARGGRCPKDGTELERRTVGGRTTYSCPLHQH